MCREAILLPLISAVLCDWRDAQQSEESRGTVSMRDGMPVSKRSTDKPGLFTGGHQLPLAFGISLP